MRKDVPCFALCHVLKDLGFPQTPSGWYWKRLPDQVALGDDPEERHVLVFRTPSQLLVGEDGTAYDSNNPELVLIKAPTNAELDEFLPDGTCFFKEGEKYFCSNILFKTDPPAFQGETAADAKARMLIWLMKNRYI